MKTDVANRFIWFKNKLVHVNDARINVLAPTSQFGLNVFEGIPCYWNDKQKQLFAFRLDDHHNRLLRSARLIQITCPYSKEVMKKALVDVVRKNEYTEDLSVRQTLFVDGFGSWGSSEPTDMFVAPIPRTSIHGEYSKKGLNTCITSWRRISDLALSPRIKCGANYINSRVGQREALHNGYDTCIFLNEEGKVSEGPGSCLFIVHDGKLITPRLTDSVLESITRDTVMVIAKDLKIQVEERAIDRTELYTCEEAFLCGSSMEITPVHCVDQYEITKDSGEITGRIYKIYGDAVRGKLEEYQSWLTPIYEKRVEEISLFDGDKIWNNSI